jgi:hypothetical protein
MTIAFFSFRWLSYTAVLSVEENSLCKNEMLPLPYKMHQTRTKYLFIYLFIYREAELKC